MQSVQLNYADVILAVDNVEYISLGVLAESHYQGNLCVYHLAVPKTDDESLNDIPRIVAVLE